jgi:hypothetical protein
MLGERIVPGASKARTAEFIDQLLAVDTHENQRSFLNALGAFERRALARTGRPCNALTPGQQDELLTEASTWPRACRSSSRGHQEDRRTSGNPRENSASRCATTSSC